MNRSRPNTWIKQIALLSLSVVMLGKAHATTPANLAAAAAEPAANASGNVGANINGAPRTPIFEYSGFNPAMLSGASDNIDVTRYTLGNVVQPGNYRVDVYTNKQWLGRRDIEVKAIPGTDRTQPCVTKGLLEQLGVNVKSLPDPVEFAELKNDACVDVAAKIPAATVDFDSGDLKLVVSIPQLYLTRISRSYVSPEEWEEGINAGFLSYNVNSYRNSLLGSTEQVYAGLNLGINLEGWRLRYNTSYNNSQSGGQSNSTNSVASSNPNSGLTTTNIGTAAGLTGVTNIGTTLGTNQAASSNGISVDGSVQQSSRWQTINAYAQHDVTSLKSQLTLGDAYSNGDLFNSVAFRGAMLASDDRMLPESQRGYAPVIRGVAETNAKVTIRQGGNIVYETTVPPGEFKIEDMYNSSFAGDFVVQISEADGRQKQYVVPYSAGVLLLRPDASRYSAVVGKLMNVVQHDAPLFGEFTYQRGFLKGITAYAGIIASSYYDSFQVGEALNTSYGAISLDLTRSLTKQLPRDNSILGHSWRLSYSKIVEQTKTNFSMAAYRYSTSDFMTLSDAAILNTQPSDSAGTSQRLVPRSTFQLSLNQPLADGLGTLYASGTAQRYWDGQPSAVNYQAGYTNGFSWGNLGVSIGRTIDAFGIYHNLWTVGLNFPIGDQGSIRHPTLNTTTTYGDHQTSTQVALNGTLGENSRTSYNLYDNYAGASEFSNASSNNVGAGMQYSGQFGQIGGSYSTGKSTQTSVNASGALIVHSGGVLLSPSLGETVGIVYAPGAEGATVNSSYSNKVGSNGYAIVPFLTPYITNEVVLDPKGSSINVELETTSKQIAPRAGAIVLLKFSTTIGRAVLMTLLRNDGQALPLGATVLDEKGKDIGMLAQGGRFFNRTLAEHGSLTIKWGSESDQQCTTSYTIPPETEKQTDQPYQQLTLTCATPQQELVTK